MKTTSRHVVALTSLLFSAFFCRIVHAQQSDGGPIPPFSPAILEGRPFLIQGFLPKDSDPPKDVVHHTGRRPDDTSSVQGEIVSGRDVYYFFEPYPMKPGSSIFQIGATFSLIAYPDAEQELPLPGLDVQYKRGIFDNIAAVGSLSTSIYSNILHGGLQWSTHIDRFSCGLADHIGFAYGFMMNVNRFDDVQAYAVFDMAVLRLGYRFDEFSCSCSFGMTYVLSSKSYVNGLEASVGPEHTINDFYATVVVEQPFLKKLLVSVGFSLGYARTPYQTWMLYNTLNDWLFAPEFFFAVQL